MYFEFYLIVNILIFSLVIYNQVFKVSAIIYTITHGKY